MVKTASKGISPLLPHPDPLPGGEGAPRLRLYDSYHCSRYNTQTNRLTPAMFRAVFDRIALDRKEAPCP